MCFSGFLCLLVWHIKHLWHQEAAKSSFTAVDLPTKGSTSGRGAAPWVDPFLSPTWMCLKMIRTLS